MANLQDWRTLLQSVGIAVPDVLKHNTDAIEHPFPLPIELRIKIYSHLLHGDSNPICSVWTSHLYIKLRRPPALANLLLACKAFYLDAVCMPFTTQVFDVVFRHSSFASLPDFDHGILLDQEHGFPILRMPLHLRVTPRLNSVRDLIGPLLRLQRVVGARQDHALRTEVRLSMDRVQAGKKVAVLRALRKFVGGLNCDVLVTDIEDVRESWEDEEVDRVLQNTDWEDISNNLIKLRF